MNPNVGTTITKCMAKSLSQQHVRADVQVTLNRTIKSIFLRERIYMQFSNNEYRPLLLDRTEDFCAYMKGDLSNILLSRLYPTFTQFTNLNHTCPYHPGLYIVKISNLTISSVAPTMLVPSGRYRIEIGVYDEFNGPMLFKAHIYGSVSDHRVEKF